MTGSFLNIIRRLPISTTSAPQVQVAMYDVVVVVSRAVRHGGGAVRVRRQGSPLSALRSTAHRPPGAVRRAPLHRGIRWSAGISRG